MSGGIFHPELIGLEESRDPLHCFLCKEQYEEPCLLECYHSFCSHCLSGRAVEGRMTCPLCSNVTSLAENAVLPPYDPLLRFLVKSFTFEETQCANCEQEQEEMYFCNTCNQPLCADCKTETHQARMFAQHDVVSLSKRTKSLQKQCDRHCEPFIMFSAETKNMLCINCFRDISVDNRSNCIDLESAYSQGCERLDHAVQAMKELQNSVQDAIVLVKALLEEIQKNASTEKTALNDLYCKIQAEVTKKKDSLLQEVDRQYSEKEALFKEQLTSLSALLPTLHGHLAMSTAFSNSANKFEFLDLGYMLMSRLGAITYADNTIEPMESSQITTNHKAEFAKCLEPLLTLQPCRDLLALHRLHARSASPRPPRQEKNGITSSGLTACTTSTLHYTSNGRRIHTNGHNVKFIEANTMFADHCKQFETSHRDILQKFELLKAKVQDTQRDMTLRRCLARPHHVKDITEHCDVIEKQVAETLSKLETKQTVLEKHWEESYLRIRTEQEVYHAQLQDLVRVQLENQQMLTILHQLQPFINSIGTVTERISPKLGETFRSIKQDDEIHALFEQISTMDPDSQQRINAITSVQEERQTQIANKTNPLDDALIKTKGMLKSPSARESTNKRDRESISEDSSKTEETNEQSKENQESP